MVSKSRENCAVVSSSRCPDQPQSNSPVVIWQRWYRLRFRDLVNILDQPLDTEVDLWPSVSFLRINLPMTCRISLVALPLSGSVPWIRQRLWRCRMRFVDLIGWAGGNSGHFALNIDRWKRNSRSRSRQHSCQPLLSVVRVNRCLNRRC